MLSMGKWEYIAAPGYLLILILLLSIDGKGSKVRSGCRRREVSSSHCARCSSERVLLITTLYMSSESWQEKKTTKGKITLGKELRMIPNFGCCSGHFLQKKKIVIIIKILPLSFQNTHNKGEKQENNLSLLPAGIAWHRHQRGHHMLNKSLTAF